MLKDKKTLVLTSVVTLLPVLAGLFLWNRLPETLPIHWNAAGEVDGYGSRAMVVFGLFGILLALHWLAVVMTAADPKNKDQGPQARALTRWIVPALSLVLAVMVYSTALGVAIRVEIVLPLFLGLLFVIIGNLLPKCRHSYTVGIKLPWTLESEDNWNATHRLAGKLWVVGGILQMTFVFVPEMSNFLLAAMILLMVLIPTVYSYLYYKKHSGE